MRVFVLLFGETGTPNSDLLEIYLFSWFIIPYVKPFVPSQSPSTIKCLLEVTLLSLKSYSTSRRT